MFVTISTYRAKVGEEDAIVALHEDWQRTLRSKVKGSLSGELVRNIADPREIVVIMRFENQRDAQALASDSDQSAWHYRLVSLTENAPKLAEYKSEWQVE